MSVKIYSQALGQLSYGRQAYTCSNQLSLVFAFWLLFWPQVICDCARPPEGLLARILAKKLQGGYYKSQQGLFKCLINHLSTNEHK